MANKRGNDFSELDVWVRGLENLGAHLEDGEGVFRRHEARYMAIAKAVGEQTLLALMPDGVDPQDWRERVMDFADLVFSRLTGNGMEILYAGRSVEDGKGKRKVPVTYQDVLEWVQAGVENGGKDKTAVENNRGRADEQIAYDVWTAIRQQHFGFGKNDYSAITARLEEWVESRVLAGDFMDLLLVVLDAWVTALEVVMERDFELWVDEVVKKSF